MSQMCLKCLFCAGRLQRCIPMNRNQKLCTTTDPSYKIWIARKTTLHTAYKFSKLLWYILVHYGCIQRWTHSNPKLPTLVNAIQVFVLSENRLWIGSSSYNSSCCLLTIDYSNVTRIAWLATLTQWGKVLNSIVNYCGKVGPEKSIHTFSNSSVKQ